MLLLQLIVLKVASKAAGVVCLLFSILIVSARWGILTKTISRSASFPGDKVKLVGHKVSVNYHKDL